MKQHPEFDIILAGAGLSGLTMAAELSRRPFFANRRLLVLERDSKEKNDRTWCFWADDKEQLPPVIHQSWEKARFFNDRLNVDMQMAPYRYNMVRGSDFYRWAKDSIAKNPNVTWLSTEITGIDDHTGTVHTRSGSFQAPLVFNSAMLPVRLLPDASDLFNTPFSQPATTVKGQNLLLQHFRGWIIEADIPFCSPDVITFMDFRVDQSGETRFVYVLPLSDRRALVEFTLFSPRLLPSEAYDEVLRHYATQMLGLQHYRIEETEFGIIPMSDVPLPTSSGGRVVRIGTAGGFVKPSTGYAFKRTWRNVRRFLDHWERNNMPDFSLLQPENRFGLYDSILLQVLNDRNELGSRVFGSLFGQLPANLVLRFLDEDTNPLEDLRILTAVPSLIFARAAFKVMLSKK